MMFNDLRIVFCGFINVLLLGVTCNAQVVNDERHINVALRMIGHQILKGAQDSTSRILPIEKEKDRFRVQFESDFQFNPEELVTIVDRVIKETGVADAYLVEVEECETGLVAYSFEVSNSRKQDIIPCKTRIQPRAHYALLFTILKADSSLTARSTLNSTDGKVPESEQTNYFITLLASFLLLSSTGLFLVWKKKRYNNIHSDLISIGKFQFDKRNMELLYKNEVIQLTSKETELLYLLRNSANKTLQREVIMKTIWGDDGHYVGRTLDVFVSKLRKKLEVDSRLKIINVRGIGYKFVIKE